MRKGDEWDPKGLIAEAYRIEGITAAECRSIFLDWALSLPGDMDQRAAIAVLVNRAPEPDHPMCAVFAENRMDVATEGRRGGARGRRP